MIAISVSSDTISFTTTVPDIDKIKKKSALVIRSRVEKNAPEINELNIGKEVTIMEFNKDVLKSLYLLC